MAAADPAAAPADPAPVAAPAPEPVVPAPEPAPVPQPVPVVEPVPVPVPTPEPVPVPEPAPVVEPVTPAPPVEPPPAVAPTDPVPEEQATPDPSEAPSATQAPEEEAAAPKAAAAKVSSEPAPEAKTNGGGQKEKVTLCHATSSSTNPWVSVTAAADGTANGHAGSSHQNGRDIIPPFSYKDGHSTKSFPGQNWNAEGQAIYERGCENPPPKKDPPPTVQINIGECVADASTPPVTATFGNLVVSQPYSYSGNGQSTKSFVASATTETRSLGNAQSTSVTVQVWGTGHKAAQGKVSATADAPNCPPPPKVTLCHATESDQNPWVELTLSPAGVLNGHVGASHHDGRDVIPPFDYGDGEHFAGQNWDAAGQAIYENGCADPEPPVDPDPGISIVTGECPVEGGFATLTVTLSDLVVGEPYSLEFSGIAVTQSSPIDFIADAATRVIDLQPTEAGGLSATVTGTGENAGEPAETSVDVLECPPPPVDPDPGISIVTGECPVEGGFAVLTVTLSDLVVGEPYSLEFSGVAVDATSPIDFTADAATRVIELQPSEEGTLTATVSGTGENAGEPADASVDVTECPDPEPPTLLLEVGQCDVFGESLPDELTASLGDLVDGLDYSVTIGVKDGGTPYTTRMVEGTESHTDSLQLPLAGAGTYVVTVTLGEQVVSKEVTVTDCPDGAYDLSLVKTASAGEDGVAEVGDTIHYTLTVTNSGPDAALDPEVTDTLPAGLTAVAGSGSGSSGWSVAVSGSTVTANYSGAFEGEATIEFDVTVTEAPASGEVTNQACVAASGAAEPEPQPERVRPAGGVLSLLTGDQAITEQPAGGGDSNGGNDCGSVTTTVRAVAVAGSAVCVRDTPWFTYSITPSGIGDTADLPIVMIWWTEEAYANRDASIPANDPAAILADGASQVDPIAYPAGWVSGQVVSGQMLWPGASIDADGNPTGWPGWTLGSDGKWVLDPTAPHYNLRDRAVVEIRINPTTSETTVYPPATPECTAQPPEPPVVPPVDPPVTPPAPPAVVVPGTPTVVVPGTIAPAPMPVRAAHPQLAETGAPNSADEQRGALGGIGIAAVLAGLALWTLAKRRRHEEV